MRKYLTSLVLLLTLLRRCWYEALKSQPCLPTTDAVSISIVGTPNTINWQLNYSCPCDTGQEFHSSIVIRLIL